MLFSPLRPYFHFNLQTKVRKKREILHYIGPLFALFPARKEQAPVFRLINALVQNQVSLAGKCGQQGGILPFVRSKSIFNDVVYIINDVEYIDDDVEHVVNDVE